MFASLLILFKKNEIELKIPESSIHNKDGDCSKKLLSGALGGPGGRWEGGSGWGRHVNPRPFHFNV